jgi:hypothetical protein
VNMVNNSEHQIRSSMGGCSNKTYRRHVALASVGTPEEFQSALRDVNSLRMEYEAIEADPTRK